MAPLGGWSRLARTTAYYLLRVRGSIPVAQLLVMTNYNVWYLVVILIRHADHTGKLCAPARS